MVEMWKQNKRYKGQAKEQITLFKSRCKNKIVHDEEYYQKKNKIK